MTIKRVLQFAGLYGVLFLMLRYLPRHDKTVPAIPAAVLALPTAVFVMWKINNPSD
jgi:hypothetical protein